MKNLIYIAFVFALFIGVTACEKEEIIPNFSNDAAATYDEGVYSSGGTRGNEDGPNDTDDGVKDPDEDEDFDSDDNIVDPDEDEDFEEEEPGK